MTITRRAIAIAISLGVALLCATVYSATSSILIEGTISDSKVFEGSVKASVRELIIKPGEQLPMHYHPGHVFIVVKSGTLTVEDGCGTETKLTAGQGLEEMDGRVHRGKNVDAVDTIVYDIFFTSPAKPTTIEVPAIERRCGPPRSSDECLNLGWKKFNHPHTFSNQRQCVEFARTMPRALSLW